MTNIASNYDEFTSLVLNGITNGLNNTEFGKNFTQELLKKLEQNPNLTVDEWKEIQSKVLKGFFMLCVSEIPELNKEFKQHCYEEVKGYYNKDTTGTSSPS